MSFRKKAIWVIVMGLLGMLFLASLYFGIVSLAESPRHAVDLFWQDRRLILPIIFGFGVQASLYTILKKRLYVTLTLSLSAGTGSTGAVAGASGTTSTLAMIACCTHHITDVLPILGLSAASAFLGRYQTQFILVGLATTYLGIAVMLVILLRERHKALEHMRGRAMLSTSTEVS